MLKKLLSLAASVLWCLTLGSAAAADPDPATLLAAASQPVTVGADGLEGPGWRTIQRETANSQFVLVGEGHNDALTVAFADALYESLRSARGFNYLALEQDPLAMELACARDRRGNAEALGALSRAHPSLFAFSGDGDLRLVARACALSTTSTPVWGLEQAVGVDIYLERLAAQAPNAAARSQAMALLDQARKVGAARTGRSALLHDDPETLPRLEALARAYQARPGSTADWMLQRLIRSAAIFGYDRRAGEGEWVGLLNNTEREAEFKRNFVRQYRAAIGNGRALPKVMFKFGSGHMYRGRGPFAAFTIGNFAHEFAISNGMDAYGILVFPGAAPWGDLPAWIKVLAPAERPTQPLLIDLRALRNYQRLFRLQVPEAEQADFRDLINGYDALVFLPEGQGESFDLTGFNPDEG